MTSVINTNISSLTAQRNLNSSQSSLATSMQRLSSGLRINSAKDDAAGLAISDRMTSQIRGMNQAVRNANDGISLAQTAEGALGEIGNNLQRIRELSVQSSNATNSTSDRTAIQAEVTQLTSEIDRVSKQSDFNGTKLLDGSFSSQLFQVGANSGQTIGVSKIANSTAGALGNVKFAADRVGAAAAGATAAATVPGSLTGLVLNGVTINTVNYKLTDTAAQVGATTAAGINAQMGETGLRATADATTGAVTLESLKANKDFTVTAGTLAGGVTAVGLGGTADTAVTAAATANFSFLSNVDVTSVKGAQQAMEIVDAALTQVSSSRAELGAVQNRFTSVVTNLQTNSENTSASRSRIQDADFAAETANLSRAQILQQAGTAMVAQANQLPQSVLSLLK
ncbi:MULTISPECIES: flagellin [unclassified Variovorax]|uniref:flagellin n=1 Tax=unclassified Variovorax TaxID=663243 RepID=UPI002B22D180|nr:MULTISPECIES: flagellin [unclassified Variovorax]MEB0059411.1 flagellin [Variovorax sp. LG9.2]MEB0114413.1 flagellin [Variovorax sp. RTB1]